MLLSPCVTSLLATMTTLFLSPLDNDRSGYRRRRLIGIHRIGHPMHWTLKIILCPSPLLVSFCREYKCLDDFPCLTLEVLSLALMHLLLSLSCLRRPAIRFIYGVQHFLIFLVVVG